MLSHAANEGKHRVAVRARMAAQSSLLLWHKAVGSKIAKKSAWKIRLASFPDRVASVSPTRAFGQDEQPPSPRAEEGGGGGGGAIAQPR